MSNYFGIGSGSVSTLFSSLSGSSVSNSTSSILSDYYSIKNGSYKKLLSAYYDKFGTDKTQSSSSTSTSTSVDSTTQLAKVKNASGNLQESATNLLSKGSTSLFKTSDVKDENGNVTKEYDMNKIYEGIKSFAGDYNTVLNTASKSNADSIKRAASGMVSTTKANSNLLKSVGITINSNNTISVDEEKLKKADVSTLKSIFNTSGSYGYAIATKASQMNAGAKFEAAKTNTYTSKGSYSSSVSTGDLYDSLF